MGVTSICEHAGNAKPMMYPLKGLAQLFFCPLSTFFTFVFVRFSCVYSIHISFYFSCDRLTYMFNQNYTRFVCIAQCTYHFWCGDDECAFYVRLAVKQNLYTKKEEHMLDIRSCVCNLIRCYTVAIFLSLSYFISFFVFQLYRNMGTRVRGIFVRGYVHWPNGSHVICCI